MKHLILPHLRINGANAFSSPFTIGVPAVTAWLGAVHALWRNLARDFGDLYFESVGIVVHEANLRVFKGQGDFVYSIVNTANPLDKDGERPSFIEEPKIHLNVSLIVEMEGVRKLEEEVFLQKVERRLMGGIKMAAGDLLGMQEPRIHRDLDHYKLLPLLGPGYALTLRRDLLQHEMQEGKDAVEGLIEVLGVHHRCEEVDGELQWRTFRKHEGWIVPVAVGFHGIDELDAPGTVKNVRDPGVPHRFAESVVTLGEFRMPHRLGSLDEMLWRFRYDEANGLYLCETKKTTQGV